MAKRSSATRPWHRDQSNRYYTSNSIEAAPQGWRGCLRAFATWLEKDRGLELSSITVRVSSVRSFLESLPRGGGVRNLRSLTSTAIEDFFIAYGQEHGSAARRSMQAALRLFLRFAELRRWVRSHLSDAVPSMRSYRTSTIPRGISTDDIRKLLQDSHKSARDRALILLVATYGVRRGQLCALRLEDIGWRDRTILFRAHKGGKAVTHQLTAAAAARVSEYLRSERPDTDEREVFLRATQPHSPLSPMALTQMIASALRRAGVTCNPRGPHALRHAFATRLLERGQPLKVIADLLGHRTLESASIYAKVDHPRLLEVAGEWPEVMS